MPNNENRIDFLGKKVLYEKSQKIMIFKICSQFIELWLRMSFVGKNIKSCRKIL